MTEDIRLEKIIAANLVWLMRHNNETQTELAQATQIDQGSMSAYVNGKYVPKVQYLMRMAEHFGVSVDELLTMQNRLDLCPFCGAEATMEKDELGWYVKAQHETGCYIGIWEMQHLLPMCFSTKEAAAEAWNRRGNEG